MTLLAGRRPAVRHGPVAARPTVEH